MYVCVRQSVRPFVRSCFPQAKKMDDSWMEEAEALGIDTRGSWYQGFLPEGLVLKSSLTQSGPPDERKEEVKDERNEISVCEDGYLEKLSKYDFIQETARAGSAELNLLLKMCIDLIVLGCHKNRVPNGSVEKTLERIQTEWKAMCAQCDALKAFSEERNRAKVREDARRTRKKEGMKKRKLDRIYKTQEEGGRGGGEGVEESVLSSKEQEQERIDRERYLCHHGYGSDLLKDMRLSPSSLYEDTKNIRRALIWCLMCLSEDVQRLIRCGKFYSSTYKCRLRYVPITGQALDEFVHLIDILKNAFYTCQMSAFNFVRCMRDMVEKKGVEHFVKVILPAAQTMETLRIGKAHMV